MFPQAASSILIIAQGTGIAPFLSLLSLAAFQKRSLNLLIILGLQDNTKSFKGIPYLEELLKTESFEVSAHICCSRELSATEGIATAGKGYLQAELASNIELR